MSTTPDFLSRRDRTALRKQYRKGEKPVRVVSADHDGRVGLLAVTDRRVVFVARGALRTRVVEFSRDQVADVQHRRERYGSLVFKTKAGRRFEAWMLERGAAEAVLVALGRGPPPKPKAGAGPGVSFKQAPARKHAAEPSTRDGSSYLPDDSAERRARLKRQLELGTITKREYEWQVESLK